MTKKDKTDQLIWLQGIRKYHQDMEIVEWHNEDIAKMQYHHKRAYEMHDKINDLLEGKRGSTMSKYEVTSQNVNGERWYHVTDTEATVTESLLETNSRIEALYYASMLNRECELERLVAG